MATTETVLRHDQSSAQARTRVGKVLALLAVLALMVLAATLRVHGLADKSFWSDEGVSVAFARLDWFNFLRILWRRELNMVLYYLLLRGWMHLGDSVAFIRGLSVVFAVAAVPAIYALGKRLFGTVVGLLAALLLALNAYHVRYAQEARSYSLVCLLVVLATYFFVAAAETGRKRDWNCYVAFSVLAVYAHFYAVLVIAAHWASLALLRKSMPMLAPHICAAEVGSADVGDKQFKRAAKWMALWTAPAWLFIVTTGAGPIRWIQRPGPRDLYRFSSHLAGNAGPLLFSLYAACVALALIAAGRAWRRPRQRDHIQLWRYSVVLAWLAVPVAVVLLVSIVKPVFLARYMIICLPALVLLAAVGLNSFRQRWMAAPVVAVIAWFALGGIHSYYLRDFDLDREDFKDATAYILDRAQPGDAVLFYKGQGRFPYGYYAARLPARAKPTIVSPGHGDTPQWRDFMGKATPQLLHSLSSQYRRVWLVMTENMNAGFEDQGSRDLRAAVGEHLRPVDQHDFPCIRVYLYAQ